MIAPLLLLFHTLPDPSGTPLLAQVRLAALRALAAQRDGAEDLEARLALFFRQQCGATKLRHLSELRLDAGSRGVFAAENSNLGTSFAVICSALAVSSVGLGAESEGLALTSSVPPSLFEASKPLLKLRVDWAATYAKAFPHRKLAWRPLLSSGVVLWRHQQGNTEICCSELQVHLLLALARRHSLSVAEVREAALAWEEGCPEGDRVTIQDHWERALAALCDGSNSPLLRHEAADIGGAGWRAEPRGAPALEGSIWLDPAPLLAPPGGWAASGVGAASSPKGRDADARAPVVDAAIVRLLKRWHVLEAEELVAKLATYPASLELPLAKADGASGFAAVRTAAKPEAPSALASGSSRLAG
eukprot:gnl/TRDRNA2_/TRDRNA2_141617_c2_seq1.p1 gnl/TRDRNA2_/TRDRNA2_141617_c2~~gnl/TRDRNA2_/TRDRNA2_141617_c2_seq1.p1  ORF type:complete len:386 (+),score=72.13 gnl/TRDRNA2_/TRDRNA2_141617_c2_seq1:80-1159(+)